MLSALFSPRVQNAIASSTWGDWKDAPPAGDVRVTVDSSLQLLAVYGSVRLISDSIATLPVDVFREADGVKSEVAKPSWLVKPTPDLDFPAWCSQVLTSLLLSGNTYWLVLRNSSAQIVAVVPLDPAKVSVRRERGRKVFYVDGQLVRDEVVHIPAMMLPGSDVGLSPIEYARQSIGLGSAAVRYGREQFESDNNMPGVIEIPGQAQPETMNDIARQWQRKRRKGGRGLPGVLQMGATWKPTGVTNEQAQFLATRQWTAAEIAGQLFLVDPSDLGIPVEGSSLTYANLEQRNIRRVQVTLLPWIVRLERALSDLLARPRYVKFNVSGLLRADMKTSFESWAIGIQNEFMVPNEPRLLMDWSPLPGGNDVVRKGATGTNGGLAQ